MSNSYVPMYIFLGLLISLGFFLPYFISDFVNYSVPNPGSVISSLSSCYIFSLPLVGDFPMNPVCWLPYSYETALFHYFNILSYIPDFILVPIAIIMLLSLIYTIIKFIPTEG